MKITLIKPNIGRREHSLYVDEGRMEPLQLGILAGLTPSNIEVKLFDDRMEDINYDEPTNMVAITVETFTARRSYEISDEFRKRGIPVIMGGIHPALIRDEAKEHCDSIVIGDAESVWLEILEDVCNNKLRKEYIGLRNIPQKNMLTNRDIFKGKGYLPISLIQFSRGCKYSCNFCASSVFFNKTQYIRNIKDVITEIEAQNRKLLFFVDDNIVSDFEIAKKLFKELIPLKIKWVSQASINMVNDKELMELMVKSGCLGNVIGFESINPQNLAFMNKGPSIEKSFDGYSKQIEILRDYGLQTWAAFTLGHDYDTIDSVNATYEFAMKNKFAFAAYNILMPYPGTKFYNDLKLENRLLYDGKWWLHPEYRFNYAAFVPKKISPEELTKACFEARRRFNSQYSIIYRAFDFKTNMRNITRFATYIAYNPLFRKEVHKKQGMKFGLKNN